MLYCVMKITLFFLKKVFGVKELHEDYAEKLSILCMAFLHYRLGNLKVNEALFKAGFMLLVEVLNDYAKKNILLYFGIRVENEKVQLNFWEKGVLVSAVMVGCFLILLGAIL